MNTHEIGDLYENQFAEYLRSLVNDGKFPGTTPGLSQVYQKKKYTNPFGLSTESDITIENKFSPNDKDYSSLIVFECKYHGETRKNLNRDLFHSFSDKINTYYGGGCKGFWFFINLVEKDVTHYHFYLKKGYFCSTEHNTFYHL